jgi:Xaa-Pro dipeptidase
MRDKGDRAAVGEKRDRILHFLSEQGCDALILGRRDNFAWFTGGGDSTVVRSSEAGFGILVVTKDTLYLVAHTMDGPRIMDEELSGLGVEPVFLRWYEQSREEKAAALVNPGKAIADIPVPGARLLPQEVSRLHYPLTPSEVERCRLLARDTEEVLAEIAAMIMPGMREKEIEALLVCALARRGIECDVLLVGSDERIAKYRHPNPTDKPVEQLVLLHPAARRWGLHANVTRMVFLGDRVPEEVAARYEAASRIAAAAISQCVPGRRFSEILEVQKRLYAQTGFPEEWRNHFQGGTTGYHLADPTLCLDPRAEVVRGQAFDWFITITGVKVEELSLSGDARPEVLSVTGAWPVSGYEYDGTALRLPQILRR